ncbi:hypothetical protein [Actinomadura oligospora]|uniref:hypothetical protein n=1 Tax=Actinomadura oligospora TaxID=111804 RepID=UPI0012F9A35E|nr:hypothetical protein [Actinomadura oligospora]
MTGDLNDRASSIVVTGPAKKSAGESGGQLANRRWNAAIAGVVDSRVGAAPWELRHGCDEQDQHGLGGRVRAGHTSTNRQENVGVASPLVITALVFWIFAVPDAQSLAGAVF